MNSSIPKKLWLVIPRRSSRISAIRVKPAISLSMMPCVLQPRSICFRLSSFSLLIICILCMLEASSLGNPARLKAECTITFRLLEACFSFFFSRDGLPTSRLSEQHQLVSAIMGRPNDRLICFNSFCSVHCSGAVWSALPLRCARRPLVSLFIVRAPSVAGWGQSLSAAFTCTTCL